MAGGGAQQPHRHLRRHQHDGQPPRDDQGAPEDAPAPRRHVHRVHLRRPRGAEPQLPPQAPERRLQGPRPGAGAARLPRARARLRGRVRARGGFGGRGTGLLRQDLQRRRQDRGAELLRVPAVLHFLLPAEHPRVAAPDLDLPACGGALPPRRPFGRRPDAGPAADERPQPPARAARAERQHPSRPRLAGIGAGAGAAPVPAQPQPEPHRLRRQRRGLGHRDYQGGAPVRARPMPLRCGRGLPGREEDGGRPHGRNRLRRAHGAGQALRRHHRAPQLRVLRAGDVAAPPAALRRPHGPQPPRARARVRRRARRPQRRPTQLPLPRRRWRVVPRLHPAPRAPHRGARAPAPRRGRRRRFGGCPVHLRLFYGL
mmetsp:Transcript_42547/g.133327  ORF Transcript_42547/g.133327 Transcript_42547/m.133327 type:complete len:371 (-) Transcript_42547:421-1533(-)